MIDKLYTVDKIMRALSELAEQKGNPFLISNQALAAHAKCSVRQLQRMLPRLLESGLINRQMKKNESGADNAYTYKLNKSA